ncbi:hypothetical protein PAXRUDRAFT_138380 [Paxillus rubicundulus Ve08.2h10]|uniref:Uncharacterized protein n=1 Tax=Paxillus rubicundulus Ve08.2h10 TaxID=930991 RepID=A0A0D0DFK5_9AGAM|nr:hypothetical protein PAXRUDRAFT_138380 [Paxillus rubicundulus Ve08.2h10]
MSLDANKEEFPVLLCQHQFPVHPAFTITINKSQLYVALSCGTHPHNINIIFPQDQNTTKTINVVFTEVLRGLIDQM